jgi:hypothetical protein
MASHPIFIHYTTLFQRHILPNCALSHSKHSLPFYWVFYYVSTASVTKHGGGFFYKRHRNCSLCVLCTTCINWTHVREILSVHRFMPIFVIDNYRTNLNSSQVVLGPFNFIKIGMTKVYFHKGMWRKGALCTATQMIPSQFCLQKIIGVFKNNYFYGNLYLKSKLFYLNVNLQNSKVTENIKID